MSSSVSRGAKPGSKKGFTVSRPGGRSDVRMSEVEALALAAENDKPAIPEKPQQGEPESDSGGVKP